jgi:hypothetical protein
MEFEEPAQGLVDFLRARIDEETNRALNARTVAGDGDLWTASHGGVSTPDRYVISAPGDQFLDRRVAQHLVDWQPQHVLAQLTLQGKIVFRLAEVLVILNTIDPEGPEDWKWEAAQAEIDGLTFAVECLAVKYQDHPEYNHAWIPEG